MKKLKVKKKYRPNVVAVIQNPEGLILACRGAKHTRDTWQCPQGGVEKGESPEEALHREIEEEIGITGLEVISRSGGEIFYEWPARVLDKKKNHFHGQAQTYFLLFAPKSLLKKVKKTKDFDEYKWVIPKDLLLGIVKFKRKAYTMGFEELGLI